MEIKEPFDDLKYTQKKIIQQLLVIQEHASDGSAFQNCKCIQEKHLNMLQEYASEGVAITKNPGEKEFYSNLAIWASQKLDHVLKVLDMNNDKVEQAMWLKLADESRELRKTAVAQAWNQKTHSIGTDEDIKTAIKRCRGINSKFCRDLINAHTHN